MVATVAGSVLAGDLAACHNPLSLSPVFCLLFHCSIKAKKKRECSIETTRQFHLTYKGKGAARRCSG